MRFVRTLKAPAALVLAGADADAAAVDLFIGEWRTQAIPR